MHFAFLNQPVAMCCGLIQKNKIDQFIINGEKYAIIKKDYQFNTFFCDSYFHRVAGSC